MYVVTARDHPRYVAHALAAGASDRAAVFCVFFCVCCGFVCVYALCFMLLSRVVALAARVKTMCSLALSSSFCIRKTSKIVYTFLINLKIGVRRIKKKWIELN